MYVIQRMALTITFALLLAQASLAQVPLCGHHCPEQEAPWRYGGWLTFPISCTSGCNTYFQAEYYYRDNCTNGTTIYQDISITGLRPIINDGNYCNLCNQGQLMREAIRNIIGFNPMNFSPTDLDPDGTCVTTWRISTGGCWYSHLAITGPVEYGVCNDNCCTVFFKICKQDGRRVIVSRLDGSGGATPECSTPPISDGGSGCRPLCPEIDDRIVGITPKSNPNKLLLGSITPEPFNSSVYPNPADEKVTIRVTATTPDNITVAISDAMGSVILKDEFTIAASDAAQYVVGTKALPVGSYYYQLLQHGVPIATGAFVVSR